MQRIKVREQRKKEHKQLYRFLPQTGSSPVPLALSRRISLRCNTKLQIAQTHSKRLLNAQGQLQETFFAQGQLQETSFAQSQLKETFMLNHKRKRLLCSITKERDFSKQLQRIEKGFEYLIYNQRYSQYNTNRTYLVFLDT